MKSFTILMSTISLVILCVLACGQPESTPTDIPPNLILIIADDMSWDDCGAYGHPSIRTPNIDRLASEGMRFDRAFLTISSCSPSRSSIITGRYPHQTDAEQLHWPLPKQQITFVERLNDAGYWTAQAGKWHLGEAVTDRFDTLYRAGTAGFILSNDSSSQKKVEAESGCEYWVKALQDRPKDRPFFMWLAALDPHRPYKEDIVPNPHSIQEVRVPAYLPDEPKVRRELAMYYDEISRLDHYVGMVMEELEAQGVEDNTMILFISDNGRPFPRDKTTLYDSGIKTPWIVTWPTRITGGSVCKSMVSALDIAPTFLSLAGLAAEPSFEGVDISTLFADPQSSVRDLIYAEDHWHDFEDQSRAVRSNQFKYIRNYYPDLANTPSADILRGLAFQKILELRNGNQLDPKIYRCFFEPRTEEELYHIEEDPNELNNLAQNPEYQEVLSAMRAQLKDWQKATADHLPEQRTPDEFNRETGEPLPNRIRPRPSKQEMFGIL